MTTNRISKSTRDYSNVSTTDRLALSRAQHFQSRENRPKSISDDEIDAISDWSESDRECCPLSDFESTHIFDGYGTTEEITLLQNPVHSNTNFPTNNISNINNSDTPIPNINDSTTATITSFTNENEKPRKHYNKKQPITTVKSRQHSQPPLLPARRNQSKQLSTSRPSTRSTINSQISTTNRTNKSLSPTSTRQQLRRETVSTSTNVSTRLLKDPTTSPRPSYHSQEEHHNHRQATSPNLSQTSVPRAYEIKKIFADDYDYGRLTDISSIRPTQLRGRQKWGTIIHPPFPLGYQQTTPEQVTQTVERLSSPARCRDRHTPIQTPSRRYLSVEETDALINRLSKVKTIRAPDQYWPVQTKPRSIKTINNNWKTVGIPA